MPWIISLAFLLLYEFVAIYMGWTTLSTMVVNAAVVWPYLIFLIGFVTGGLSVHFFWHWDPTKGRR